MDKKPMTRCSDAIYFPPPHPTYVKMSPIIGVGGGLIHSHHLPRIMHTK